VSLASYEAEKKSRRGGRRVPKRRDRRGQTGRKRFAKSEAVYWKGCRESLNDEEKVKRKRPDGPD